EETYHNGQLNDEKLVFKVYKRKSSKKKKLYFPKSISKTNQTKNYVTAIKLRNRQPKMTPTMKKCTITEDSNDEYPRRKAEKV
ncbi:14997_t:CDS:1, partial [Gigaspora margarita]